MPTLPSPLADPGPGILIDTREQLPFTFSADVQTTVGTLSTGDYSIPGFEDQVTIERKSKPDLFGSCGSGRERFKQEWERMAEFRFAVVVIELKKGRESDRVVGQTLRYMGWVAENLCPEGEDVKGLIICREVDERLEFALKMVQSMIQVKRYSVSFQLHDL